MYAAVVSFPARVLVCCKMTIMAHAIGVTCRLCDRGAVPAQPCYNLQKLHLAIRHDLPPTPNGFVEVWDVILGILYQQRK